MLDAIQRMKLERKIAFPIFVGLAVIWLLFHAFGRPEIEMRTAPESVNATLLEEAP